LAKTHFFGGRANGGLAQGLGDRGFGGVSERSFSSGAIVTCGQAGSCKKSS
jgi:hypothetical protein